MTQRIVRAVGILILAGAPLLCWATNNAVVSSGRVVGLFPDPDIIQVGIVDSLVKDLSPGKRKLLDSEFPNLMEEFTELKSAVLQGGDPFTAVKKLADGKWHLGVFQGVEFAWAQAKDAKLQPLMIAIGRERLLRA